MRAGWCCPLERLEHRRVFTVSLPEVSVHLEQNGAEDGQVATIFQFARDGDLTSPLTAQGLLVGTAKNGLDFTSSESINDLGAFSISFSPGSATATLTLSTLADNVHDPAETLRLILRPDASYRISPANDRAIGVISDSGTSSTYDAPTSPTRSLARQRNADAFAALLDNGTVVAWGSDLTGGFLDDTYSYYNKLVTPSADSYVTKIASNEFAFTALLSDGTVAPWGEETSGGDNWEPATTNVVDIASSASTFIAIKDDKSIAAWGGTMVGDPLSPEISLPAGIEVTSVASTDYAYAAILSNGKVATWGDWGTIPEDVNDGTDIDWDGPSNNLTVEQIFSTNYAFAALQSNGSVLTWGYLEDGGDSSGVDFNGPNDDLFVKDIASTQSAFAAIFNDGSVATWGYGSDSSSIDFDGPNDDLYCTKIFSNDYAFAALLSDGTVRSWGNLSRGGDSSGVDFSGPNNDLHVVDIVANSGAFAAIRNDGTLVTWGESASGGDSTSVVLGEQRVVEIVATDTAFAAMLDNNQVVAWGDPLSGGDIGSTNLTGLSGTAYATHLTANSSAFVAILSDGSAVTWGNADRGGNSGDVDFNGSHGLAKVVAIASPFIQTTLLTRAQQTTTSIESTGNVSLNRTADGRLLANAAAITHAGAPMSTEFVGRWTIIEAENIRDTNYLIGQQNDSGFLHRWPAGPTWEVASAFDVQSTTSIFLSAADRNLGGSQQDYGLFEFAISMNSNTTLSVLESGQLRAWVAGITDSFDLMTTAADVQQNTFLNHAPIAAKAVTATDNRLLLRGQNNTYTEILFDNTWRYLSEGNTFSTFSEEYRLAELRYSLDLDFNGIVGTLGS